MKELRMYLTSYLENGRTKNVFDILFWKWKNHRKRSTNEKKQETHMASAWELQNMQDPQVGSLHRELIFLPALCFVYVCFARWYWATQRPWNSACVFY